MKKKFLRANWPGPLSVILPAPGDEFKYLHRGANSLSFRLPDDNWLLNLLKKSGPLVAPSANIEGQAPAETIDQAVNYFDNKVDFS